MRYLIMLTAALAATGVQAQGRSGAGVSAECRAEVVKLCPASDDRAARRSCMMEKRAQVSGGCRSELMAAREARRAAKPAPAPVVTPATPTPPSS